MGSAAHLAIFEVLLEIFPALYSPLALKSHQNLFQTRFLVLITLLSLWEENK